MGGGLIGHHIGQVSGILPGTRCDIRKHVGGVTQQTHRDSPAVVVGILDQLERVIQIVGPRIEVAGPQARLDRLHAAFHCDHRGAIHGRCQRLGAAHATEPRSQYPPAFERAAKVLSGQFCKRFIGSLNDALGADINPGSGRHLSVHHQALLIQF